MREFIVKHMATMVLAVIVAGVLFAAGQLPGCVVSGQCFNNDDCAGGEVCEAGRCLLECSRDDDCETDESCMASRCEPAAGCNGCPYPRAPHASSDCVHGDCRILACDADWLDADNDPRTGCECTPTLDGNEACDGVDNDCNGKVDEGCACTPTNDGVEICDGIDNDCNNQVDEGLLCCPDDMLPIDGTFCIDRYEASHADATAITSGTSPLPASKPGVLPWLQIAQPAAGAACEAVGKRLCNPGEWLAACVGAPGWKYSYGTDYDAGICNGIDAYCEVPEYGCGLEERPFKLAVTGDFPQCKNPEGAFDINGNAWEWDSDPQGHARGGAYNCSDSRILHQCDYIRTNAGANASTNIGFRCCK